MKTRELKYKTLWKRCEEKGILQYPWEYDSLLQEIHSCKVRSVLEIGCNTGGSAYGMLAQGLTVVSVDIEVQRSAAELLARFPETHRMVEGDSAKKSTMIEVDFVLKELDLPFVDCLFIDAGHTAGEALEDYLCYRGFVRAGGIIVFHDIVDSALCRKHNINVCDTWNVLKKDYPYKEIIENGNAETGERGIGILYT